MKSPAFQFYPGDWRRSANLRRCSIAARGAWMEVLCLMHDSAEYGVLRWPLQELARAAGVPVKLLRELVECGVLKGADSGATGFIHRPRHARQDGPEITLLRNAERGPLWYSSRMLVDEYNRSVRGGLTRFRTSPNHAPIRPNGERVGDGFGEPFGEGFGAGASSAVAVISQAVDVIGKSTTPKSPTKSELRAAQVIEAGRIADENRTPMPDSLRSKFVKSSGKFEDEPIDNANQVENHS